MELEGSCRFARNHHSEEKTEVIVGVSTHNLEEVKVG